MKKILYVDCIRRTPMIHTMDSVMPAVTAFSAIADQLETDRRFLCCNRAIYVNMDWILGIEERELILKNGERLPIRIRGRAQVKKEYLRYMLQELREMMKKHDFGSLRPLFVMLASAVVSVTVILILYFYNNIYTQDAGQPREGYLDLRADGDSAREPRWLTGGWEFYPGQLLGPEDFDGGSAGQPYIVSLGKYGKMQGEKGERWIKGTFRLRLALPAINDLFALEMPEISAASRVYIQNRMAAQWGDPGLEFEGIRSAVIPIGETGEIQILVQAADLAAVHTQMFKRRFWAGTPRWPGCGKSTCMFRR